jgi:hypothetical protein
MFHMLSFPPCPVSCAGKGKASICASNAGAGRSDDDAALIALGPMVSMCPGEEGGGLICVGGRATPSSGGGGMWELAGQLMMQLWLPWVH